MPRERLLHEICSSNDLLKSVENLVRDRSQYAGQSSAAYLSVESALSQYISHVPTDGGKDGMRTPQRGRRELINGPQMGIPRDRASKLPVGRQHGNNGGELPAPLSRAATRTTAICALVAAAVANHQ